MHFGGGGADTDTHHHISEDVITSALGVNHQPGFDKIMLEAIALSLAAASMLQHSSQMGIVC